MFWKNSSERDVLREKMKNWVGSHPGYSHDLIFDAAILETFFYIYNGLDKGMTIYDLGKELGVFPLA